MDDHLNSEDEKKEIKSLIEQEEEDEEEVIDDVAIRSSNGPRPKE